ncbi:unnamed protein product [Sphagnum troendelagicum]|uniref:Uncharacterized protein n=1 Tax=Sphagnum troendelagicum TaxID=128251 RepID=A0ABP0TH14_9BRYO
MMNAKLMQGQLYPLLCSLYVLVMATLLTGGGLQSAVAEAVDITFFYNSGAWTKGLVLRWRRNYRRYLLRQQRRVDHFNDDLSRGNQIQQLLFRDASP